MSEIFPPSLSSPEEVRSQGKEEEGSSKVEDHANDPPPPSPSPAIPAHLSHDPTQNLKRSAPFKFGSRILSSSSNIFEFNAWDHVLPDATHHAYAESQYTLQRSSPVTEYDKRRFNSDPAKWWDKFYANNTSNFFKNRKWLHQEFPVLSRYTARGAGKARILEVGAGAGNTAFPILQANENDELMLYACDFSKKAVELIRGHEAYDPRYIAAEVWDVAATCSPGDEALQEQQQELLPPGVAEESIDVVILIFIFSALSPDQWDAAVRNLFRVLKPGGEICFRDYGRGDLTQVRFRKGRYLQESFYIRGDGTRVYFFDEDELRNIWTGVAIDGEEGSREQDSHNHNGDANHDHHEKTLDNSSSNDRQIQEADDVPVATPTPATPPRPKFIILSLGVDRRMLVNRQKQLKMYRCWMQGHFQKPHIQEH